MAEVQKEIELEIAHVLLIENVGYSKLTTKEQSEALQERNSPAFGLVSFAAKPPSCASGSRGRTNVVPPSGDYSRYKKERCYVPKWYEVLKVIFAFLSVTIENVTVP